ncbi:MAG: radical SAM protein [Desulfobacteraceae bacterium]|nr:MAG: radical SAM protein [Desulfobacteraceae bacterium]
MAFIANIALANLIERHCREQAPLPESGDAGRPLAVLERLGFFTPACLPEDEYKQRQWRHEAAVLFLTNRCNLRCIYCYASAGDFAPQEMPWEIARAAVDQVIGDCVANGALCFTLGFHGGGEPTLNLKILKRTIAYARRRTSQENIGLTVTGSFNGFWGKACRTYMLEQMNELSLSFDGPPEVQNRQRPARNGRASFDRVAQTLTALDNSGLAYGIRMTITPESAASLAENIRFICNRFHPRKIQVEPVFAQGRAREHSIGAAQPDVFLRQFMTAYGVAQQSGIELFYSGARPDILTRRFCLAACRALVVTPQGEVTTCFETYGRDHPLSAPFRVGVYDGQGGFRLDHDKIGKHMARTVDEIPYCEACFCKWHCAGDCAIKASRAGQVDRFQPTERCFINQELTKFLLLEKIKSNGGLFWVRDKNTEEKSDV